MPKVQAINALPERKPSTVTNSCLICSAKKMHYAFSVDKYRAERCSNCGLMRLNPQPTDAELSAIYNPEYFFFANDPGGQAHTSELKLRTAQYYLDTLTSYCGGNLSGNLLEVGCGHGDFLMEAAARGLEVTGIEYSTHSAEVASKKLGNRAKIIVGEIADLANSEERFDFIVFSDVLEHVRDPRAFLRHTHRLLRKDGVLLAVVPSLDSTSARLMKSKWIEFKPEHLWYFSTATLTQLFHSEGFGSLKVTAAKKSLSFDYIAEHFGRFPVEPISSTVNLVERFLPSGVRRFPIQVAASGIVATARKEDVPSTKRLDVVMAAYNEAGSIRNAIERVLNKEIDNIEIGLTIVESNSTDGTREIVREYEGRDRVNVIWQEQPRGKGNAVRAGLEQVRGNYVLIQDADDEYDIEDYDSLLEPLVAGEASFVLGARHGGGAWKMRQFNDHRLTGHLLNFGHWFFASLINVAYGLQLRDPFTMYKVFRADCLRGLRFECDRFDFDCELLIKLVRKGYRPVEIPVNYRSRSFKEGKKVDVFRDPWTWIRAILRFRFKKL